MGRTLIETIMGGVVLLVAGGFLYFAFEKNSLQTVDDGYTVRAVFDDVGGIGVGSDVRIGGIKIGVVDSMNLDPQNYRAEIGMQVKKAVRLPKDTSATIASAGLLGDKFIKLEPGGDNMMLSAGDVITFTQSSVSLEELIGKFMFSGGGVESDQSDAGDATEEDNPFSLGVE